MSKVISKTAIKSFRQNTISDSKIIMARNALTRGKTLDVAMNWDAFSKIDHTFSHRVEGEMAVTDQKHSGRCWGFAGLNLMRNALGKKYKIKQFEFSQNYFMFWDKMEKANYFIESIITTLKVPLESRLIWHLLQDPIQDGGQWDMFVNIVEKYGVVPKSVMPESKQSSNSHYMNHLITQKLREFASVLRKMYAKNASHQELRFQKKEMLNTVYRMLTINLGTPPETFDWQVRNKDKKFLRFTNLTPQEFYKEHLDINLKNKICLINAPMKDKPFNQLFTVQFLGNVLEGQIVKYINLESEKLKRYAIKSIKNDEPVWFGCDVGKMLHGDLGVMDMELFDYELLYNTSFNMNKKTRLHYSDSQMTHAMLFTGVDIKNRKSVKWRVENSWAEKLGDKGYYLMTDNWFDEYLYEIVIDKQYLPQSLISIYDNKPIKLDPWDPMGSLAKHANKLL